MTTCSSCHEKKSTLCRALDDLLKEANMTDEGRKHSYNVDDVLSTLLSTEAWQTLGHLLDVQQWISVCVSFHRFQKRIHLLSSSLNHTANVLPHHPNQSLYHGKCHFFGERTGECNSLLLDFRLLKFAQINLWEILNLPTVLDCMLAIQTNLHRCILLETYYWLE